MKSRGMVSGKWFALLSEPDAVPVLFASKAKAKKQQCGDEYIVAVHVRPLALYDLGRGERLVLERRRSEAAAKKQRPRLSDTEKRRRGPMVKVNLSGVKKLNASLKKMAPLMRQRFVDVMNGELKAIGLDLARGADRSVELEVTRGRNGKLKFREVKRAAAPRVRR